ncbi:hypothetical protein sortregn_22 [Escherichia phage sortregn]|nr:hypothetical protein sortregn_22 [Escherichia phage sortregn]
MIRYVAVTAVKNGEEVIHIPETLIESLSKIDNGRAEIVYRELREDDISEAYSSTTDWRITGYASEKAYSVMPYDDLIAWLNGLPASPLILDLSKAEQDKIRRTLNATQQTLDEIQPRLQPGPTVGIESDVLALIRLLKDREYAEHWATSALGADLEEEITKLIGHDNAAASRLQRAETLLAEIHHSIKNDGGLFEFGPDEPLVARLSEYLYPNSTNC